MRQRDHISNRVADLAMAEGDILGRLADIEAEQRSLRESLQAFRLERYQLTEISAPGPLFSLLRDKSASQSSRRAY